MHRDIKPANRFVTQRGQAKILDFGLAKLMPERAPGALHHLAAYAGSGAPSDVAELSSPGSPIGTVAYMSPEQARCEPLDARTDLFSFGAVLYEMATGLKPFTGAATTGIGGLIFAETPPSAIGLNPDLTPGFEAILGKALEQDRQLRYQSAAEMLADIKSLIDERALAPAPPSNRLASKWIAALAVPVAAAIAVAGWLYSSREKPPPLNPAMVVMADFVNSTGATVFDEILKPALAAEFQQSGLWRIVPAREITRNLQFMVRPRNAHLDTSTSLELCQRTGSALVLLGSISRLGAEYVLGLNALDCQTGAVLGNESVQVTRQEKVLDALRKAAQELGARLGPPKTQDNYALHWGDVTTPSLDAWRAYIQGRAATAKRWPDGCCDALASAGHSPRPELRHGVSRAGPLPVGVPRRSRQRQFSESLRTA